ncbi:hypothetical protein LH86_02415 [Cedecea neteri]|nr:hypothetical protein LH86_02415 [Cedecea neteri]
MNGKYGSLIVKTMITAILPLFFGSLLFSGLIESYKNDMSSRKEILNDYYRPMRDARNDCHKKHNELFLQYGLVAGALKLFADETKRVSKMNFNRITYEQAIFYVSVVDTFRTEQGKLNELKKNVSDCTSVLNRMYTELSVVTGSYDEFVRILAQRTALINDLYRKRADFVKNSNGDLNEDEYMKMIHEFISLDFSNDALIAEKLESMQSVILPLVPTYLGIGENERKVFDAEYDMFVKLNEIYLEEMNSRFKRGVIARLFF